MEHKKQDVKMRIGIITLQPRFNYGGIMQAYAMQKVLTRLGHQGTLIDSIPSRLPYKTKYLIYIKRAILKYLFKKNIIVRLDKKTNKEISIKGKHTFNFINNHINKVNKAKDFSDISKNEFDAFIVGSDQVWRPKYFHTHIKRAFLDFTKNWETKRIAYAASFGTDEWEFSDEETNTCSTLAQKFDAISVREISAINICKEHLGANATHVLDPTMLLSSDDYKELFEKADTPQSSGNLMCYILDRNNLTENIINTVVCEKDLKPFIANSKVEDPDAALEEQIQPPVENWLRGFYDAEYVVTDSFHACVFSIIFNKPFIVFGNKSRGMTRFKSLLTTFGLEERLIATAEEAKTIIKKEIDWKRVNKQLKYMQEISCSFLESALNSSYE